MESREQPLVILVLSFFISTCHFLFNTVSVILTGPLLYIHRFVAWVNITKFGHNLYYKSYHAPFNPLLGVTHDHHASTSVIVHYFMIPVRYVLSFFGFPLSVLCLYAIYHYLSVLSVMLHESWIVRWISIIVSIVVAMVMHQRALYLLEMADCHRALFVDFVYMQFEMFIFLISLFGHAFVVRIPAFFADLSRAQPNELFGQCLKHAILSVLIVIGLALSPILLINVSRIPHVYRSITKYTPQQIIGVAGPEPPPANGQRNVSFGEVLVVQEMRAFLETPFFYLSIIFGVLAPYRVKKYATDLYRANVDDRLGISLNFIQDAMIDVPFILMALLLTPMVWRWYSIAHYLKTSKSISLRRKIADQFAAALLDLPMILSLIIVCLSVYRIGTVKSQVTSKWSEQDYRAIDFHLIIIHSAIEVILDTLSVLSSVVVLVCIYRIHNLYVNVSNRGEHKFRTVVIREVQEQITDIPYILISVLCLWRIPYLLYSIYRAGNAVERRSICLRQAKQALIDIPFGASVILLSLSILHLLTLTKFYKRYLEDITRLKTKQSEQTGSNDERNTALLEKRVTPQDLRDKYRYLCMKNALLLPLQVPFIACTYILVLTVYRLPTTIKIIKSCAEKPNKKALVLKTVSIQTLSILLDILVLLSSSIVMVTIWKANEIIEIMKTNSLFVVTYDFAGSFETHKKLFRVFVQLVMDIPLFLLIIFSSFAVWRVGYIRKLLHEEKDYRKRMVALGLSALLTILDIPCLLCTLLVLCSWRSKAIQSLIVYRWREGTMSFIHAAVFKEFYELIIDIPFIIMAPLSLWRFYIILKLLMICPNAQERRRLVFTHFKEMIKDIPYTFLTLFVVMSTYRIQNIVQFLKLKDRRKISYRMFILYEAKQLAIDLPYVTMAFLSSVILPFRLYGFFKNLYTATSDEDRRNSMTRTTAGTTVDLITALYAVALVITVYRLPMVALGIKKRGFGHIRKILAEQVYLLLVDIQCLINSLLILGTIFHIVQTMRIVVKFLRYMIQQKKKERERVGSISRKTPVLENRINELPPEILASAFAFLEPTETCNTSLVSKYWKEVSNEGYLWQYYCERESIASELSSTQEQDIYHFIKEFEKKQQTFIGIVWSAFAESPYKMKYVTNYIAKKSKEVMSLEEVMYRKGFRALIHEEFVDMVNHLQFFFMLPAMLVAVICLPFLLLLNLALKQIGLPRGPYVYSVYEVNVLASFCTEVVELLLNLVELIGRIATSTIPWITKHMVRFNFFNISNWEEFMYRKELYRILFGILNLVAAWYFVAFALLNFAPLYFPIRQWVMASLLGLWSYWATIIGAIYTTVNNVCWALPLTVFGVAIHPLAPHAFIFKMHNYILVIASSIVNWVLDPQGYLNLGLFYLIWWFCTFGTTRASVTEATRTVPKFFPLFGITHSYIGLLGFCARCGYSIGIVGEILLIPISILWIIAPLSILFWYRAFTATIPALIVCFLLLLEARRELNTKWRQVKNIQQ